jgi:hypothetical protein
MKNILIPVDLVPVVCYSIKTEKTELKQSRYRRSRRKET